jgi:hypothetical protein
MPPPKTPKKPSATEKKTAQTGMMEELDAPRPGYVTPKKPGKEEEFDSPVKSVEVEEPTEEEAEIGSRQEKLEKDLMSASTEGGRKRRHTRKHAKKSKKVRKTRKVKKHGKRKH